MYEVEAVSVCWQICTLAGLNQSHSCSFSFHVSFKESYFNLRGSCNCIARTKIFLGDNKAGPIDNLGFMWSTISIRRHILKSWKTARNKFFSTRCSVTYMPGHQCIYIYSEQFLHSSSLEWKRQSQSFLKWKLWKKFIRDVTLMHDIQFLQGGGGGVEGDSICKNPFWFLASECRLVST